MFLKFHFACFYLAFNFEIFTMSKNHTSQLSSSRMGHRTLKRLVLLIFLEVSPLKAEILQLVEMQI